MAELIGATYELPDVLRSSFKHHLLVFDRIACATAAPLLKEIADDRNSGRPPDKWIRAITRDLPWLMKEGLVFSPEWKPPENTDFDMEEFDQYLVQHRDMGSLMVEYLSDTHARQFAIHLKKQQLNAVPITCGWSRFPNEPSNKVEAIQLVINELPIPGQSHSYQDILAFRKEANELGLTRGLRVWINEMASGKLTQVEMSDKLQDLVSRYDRALKLEKMSRTTGVLETLVVTTAEIAESLVKFQWSKLAKKPFEVRHKQIDLMKAEMTLPGHEVAYIVKARERFGDIKQ